MRNAKTLELRTLDDEELLGVVGGWGGGGDCGRHEKERNCSPCGGGLDIDIDVDVDVCVSL